MQLLHVRLRRVYCARRARIEGQTSLFSAQREHHCILILRTKGPLAARRPQESLGASQLKQLANQTLGDSAGGWRAAPCFRLQGLLSPSLPLFGAQRLPGSIGAVGPSRAVLELHNHARDVVGTTPADCIRGERARGLPKPSSSRVLPHQLGHRLVIRHVP